MIATTFHCCKALLQQNSIVAKFHGVDFTHKLNKSSHIFKSKHVSCPNLNIGFMTKCEMQGPMRPRMCLMWNTLSQMGESAKDEAQWLPITFPLWELHLCESYECSKHWLKRQTNFKLSPQDTIRKVLMPKCLKCLHIIHLDLIYMNYDQ